MSTPTKALAAAAALVLAAATTQATPTEVFVDDSAVDFRAGDITTSTLTMDGVLTLPARRQRVAKLEADIVWDAVRASDGTIYATTGHEGRVFAIDAKGAIRVAADFDQPVAYSLAIDGKGGLLAATSPDGVIRRIGPNGAGDVVARTGQTFVWKMIPRADGSILAATGPEGRIVKVDATGTTSTLARIPDTQNVMDIAEEPDGSLVAATQGRGLVARIAPDGSVRVLLDPEQEEVRRVLPLSDGRLVAATNGQRAPGERFLKRTPQGAPARERSSESKPRENSALVLVDRDGFADEVFASPESPIHDIARDGDRIVLSAGTRGALMAVGLDGRAEILGASDDKVASRLVALGGGSFLVGTGDIAAIDMLETPPAPRGVFESRVLNSKSSARWGRIIPVLNPLGGGTVTIQTRSGNTAKADATWAPWTAPVALDPAGVANTAPPGRFLQYRLTLEPAPGGKAPLVEALRLFYREANQPPVVSAVEVRPSGQRGAAAGSGGDGDKPSPRSTTQTTNRSGTVGSAPDSNGKALDVNVKAEDPNGDALTYTLFVQQAGSDRWMQLGEPQRASNFRVETRGIPDGLVRFRAVVDDHESNLRGEERSGMFVTPFLTVDNAPPQISRLEAVRRDGAPVRINVKADDPSAVITGAMWRADGGEWHHLAPVDGIFDDRSEVFEFELTAAESAKGTVITVVITDDGGNTASGSVILE